MILLVGGTGELGRRIARRLSARKAPFRALLRPGADGSELEALAAGTALGDLRDRPSLDAALSGVETVITTVTAIGRALGGERNATIRDVDARGAASRLAGPRRAP